MYDQKNKVEKVVNALAASPGASTYSIAASTRVISSEVDQILNALKRERKVRGYSSSWHLEASVASRYRSGSSYGSPSDNAGELGLELTDGDLAIGIGGGLTIDSGGDLGLQIAPGISIDLGGNDGNSGFGF